MLIDSNELIGKTLGTCTLERQIGHGGMGAVYLARQTRPRRQVAVKVLLPGPSLDERARADFLERFRREADAIAVLDHINIMPVFEYGELDQHAYLVMPYITGGTLRQILNVRGSLPLNEALPIIEQIAEALDYAHERGIIHRDIKPGNILFHADGRLLLADFGLAKVLSETGEGTAPLDLHTLKQGQNGQNQSNSLSQGAMIGTPEYLSPEQALGRPIDRRTDIYSLGILLFQILTGKVPFIGLSPISTAIMHAQNEPPSPSSFMPTISPRVEAVILHAIAKQPEMRYSTAGEFAHALRIASGDSESSNSNLARKTPSLSTHILLSNDTEPEIERVLLANAQTESIDHLSDQQTTIRNSQPEAPQLQAATQNSQPEAPQLQIATQNSQPEVPQKKSILRKKVLLSVVYVLPILLLVSGGFIAYFNLKHAITTIQHTPTPQGSTNAGSPTIPSGFPTPPVPVGNSIYSSVVPNSACPGGQGSWSQDTNAVVSCWATATELTNTLRTTHYLASMFLNGLANGQGIPTNYVLQVETLQPPDSRGLFGVLFRNQPDQGSIHHNGAYAFMIDPASDTWSAIYYNDSTGAATYLATNILTVPLNTTFTIDIVVQGTTFTLYLNGKLQGSVTNAAYPTGTIGFSVDPNTDIYFSHLAIYEPANQ